MSIEAKEYERATEARSAAKALGLSEFDVYKAPNGVYKIRVAARKAAKRWWAILGVDKIAAKEDILAAYRSLALKRHPDKKGGDTAMMKELNLAREAGLKAAPAAKAAPKAAKAAKAPKPKAAAATKAHKEPSAPTKGEQLFYMIKDGTTVTEIMNVLGWQRHTVRGAISRLGRSGRYRIVRTKVGKADDGFEFHYKIKA